MVKQYIPAQHSNDYQALYDKYWAKEDRIGASSGDMEDTANQIVTVCGVGKALDIGSGEGLLVEKLLKRNVDAYGLDVSEVVVSRCNQRFPGRFTHGSVLTLPYEDGSFQTVISTDCFEHLASEDVALALKEVWRVSKRYFFLKVATAQDRDAHWHLTVEGRAWWETQCFEAGFRKHPAYYRINPYESLNNDGWQITILLEKISLNALSRYPLESLRQERDLHMDMLRETGSRSDAHVGRYHFASKFVRPGDVVLDAACGLGYGSYLLHSTTKARSFTSIDGSKYAIDYAQDNFGGEVIVFRQGLLPDCLADIPSNSIDHVLCFETLEHVEDPIGLLAELHRVLTPGGRMTCSVPNDWSDESGNDPNPFHLHVYNKKRFLSELGQFFDIEFLVAQTADRVKQAGAGCVWLKRPRSLTYVREDESDIDIEAEWLLAVVTKSPFGGHLVAYEEQVFSPSEVESAGHALSFARDYRNPWLLRSLVSIGLRTENVELRKRWSMTLLEDHRAGAADRGAALCVIAYADLASGSSASVARLLEMIESYLDETEDIPNFTLLRWRVSLMHVGGLLALAHDRQEVALRFFQSVVAVRADQFSATLLTKPAEAAYLLGMLLAERGMSHEAHEVWWGAFRKISQALGERLARGYELRPPMFEVREMAAALSLCGRLVAAAANVSELGLRPTVFYDEVHADSVSQGQLLLAAERKVARLHAELLLQRSAFEGLSRGKEWLETQWRTLEAERLRLQEELVSLQSGKDWLEAQWSASNAERSRLQEGLVALQSGKDWLEAQWSSSNAERSCLQEELVSLQWGKDWLEAQWNASKAERSRLQEELASLQIGKDWLEMQWNASKVERSRVQEELASLQIGKDWLEMQWNASKAERSRLQEELASLQIGKDWLQAQWIASNAEGARLQGELASLQSGKHWLETQWNASKVERSRVQEELASLQSGKDWLETQWELHLMELDVRQQRIKIQQTEITGLVKRLDTLSATNTRLTADLMLATDKAARLKQSRIFKFARKIGFFDFF